MRFVMPSHALHMWWTSSLFITMIITECNVSARVNAWQNSILCCVYSQWGKLVEFSVAVSLGHVLTSYRFRVVEIGLIHDIYSYSILGLLWNNFVCHQRCKEAWILPNSITYSITCYANLPCPSFSFNLICIINSVIFRDPYISTQPTEKAIIRLYNGRFENPAYEMSFSLRAHEFDIDFVDFVTRIMSVWPSFCPK